MEIHEIKRRFNLLAPFLSENLRRRVAAAEAMAIGYGGISIVSRETGLSRGAIALGCKELKHPEQVDETRIRRKGGGRKQATVKDPTLKQDLNKLIEPIGDTDTNTPLHWTCKSLRVLAAELNEMGHKISHNRIADLLHELGYRLQGNQKALYGASAETRNYQFRQINKQVQLFQEANQPVIFVDIKSCIKNGSHGISSNALAASAINTSTRHNDCVPKTAKNSEFDHCDNDGEVWSSVEIDQDTAAFAVDSLRQWWYSIGSTVHPDARRLLIIIDNVTGSSYRIRLWKNALQNLVNNTGLDISVCHLPPGTSKWSKSEQQQCSFNNQHLPGKQPVSHRVTINLITVANKNRRRSTTRTVKPFASDIGQTPIIASNQSTRSEWSYSIRVSN